MKWIKCSERLPEQSGHYLIAKVNVVYKNQWYYAIVHYSAMHKQWNNYDDMSLDEGDDIYKADYWMPIPEVEE